MLITSLNLTDGSRLFRELAEPVFRNRAAQFSWRKATVFHCKRLISHTSHHKIKKGSSTPSEPGHFISPQALLARYSGIRVADVLGGHAPHLIACIYKDEERSGQMTYGELRVRSVKLAGYLHERGVRKGDSVAIMLPKIPELLIAGLAVWRLGAVYVPLFTAFAEHAIDYRCRHSDAKVLVTDVANLDKVADSTLNDVIHTVCCVGKDTANTAAAYSQVRGIVRNCLLAQGISRAADRRGNATVLDFNKCVGSYSPDAAYMAAGDTMACLYTSGTTGQPKGVPIPVKALASYHMYMIGGVGVRDADVYWNAADAGWAYGLYYNIIGPMLLGKPSILVNQPYTGEAVLDVLTKYQVSNFTASPTLYRMLKTAWGGMPLDTFSEVKVTRASSAGEPLNPEVVRFFEQCWNGVHIRDHYGQTEVGMVIGNLQCRPSETLNTPLASMGQNVPGWQVTLLQNEINTGHWIPVEDINVPGEVAVDVESPLFHFTGYYKDEEKSAARFVNASDGRQYYLTGDIAYRDDNGFFFFKGRDDDVILSAGYRIGPFEVESELLRHPSVDESAVVGVPDETRGEVVKAFVVLTPSYQHALQSPSSKQALADELKAFVKTHLSAHEYPRIVEFVDQLPKTSSGKIQRYILRNL